MISRRQFLGGMAAVGGMLVGGDFATAGVEDFIGQGRRLPSASAIRAADPQFWRLVDMINDYRAEMRLPKVALSPKLTAVAALHVRDLEANRPHEMYGSMHSWSKSERWRGGPFDRNDESTHAVMFDKPKELFGYPSYGFEVMVKDARDVAHALATLQASKRHDDVLVNRGPWADDRWQWKALGAVFYKGFASAWFGNEADAA